MEFSKHQSRLPKRRFTRPENSEDIESVNLYIGDDSGYVKVWDLSFLLDQCGHPPEAPYFEKMGSSFNPNRSENIDVKAYANSLH